MDEDVRTILDSVSITVTDPDLSEDQQQQMREQIEGWVTAARANDLPALYSVGACLDIGDWMSQDKEAASRLFRYAAEQGHAHCQYIYGIERLFGRGTYDTDQGEGIRFLTKAADQEHKYALETLADCYSTGEAGCAVDTKLAEELRHRAEAAKDFWEDSENEVDVILSE